jgi:hypothetical protein
VLTDWIVAQASRVAPSPFSNETQELIKKYVPTHPEKDRRFRELALVVGYSLPLPPVAGFLAFAGWLVYGGDRPSDQFVRIVWGLIVVLLAGLWLHLIRFCDASVAVRRGGTRSDHRWPRASSDLDFIVQIAVGVAAVILGAPA